ncbi:potassium-transporting ATPase subunit KdpA, partial [bacterium]|nr:potassium-transporting ATPase subunit KdpA [bacterium]
SKSLGVGSGLYGSLVFVILAIFIAGLVIGRTPEYLGKKIEAAEIRLAVVGVLLPSVLILVFSSLAAVLPSALKSLSHTGAHGLTEILYAFSSSAGNNGSAFAGLNANTIFYNVTLAVCMFVGRFGVIVPVLALAGHLSRKAAVPESAGTFPVSGVLFASLLGGVVLIVGALTFFPALALGPIVEHLQFLGK